MARTSVGTLLAEVVSGNYFQLLGVNAALGRMLLPEDDIDRGGHAVIVLGFRYWRQAFGGSVDAVGRELRIGGRSYRVVGVAPADFLGSITGLTPAFFAPAAMVEELIGDSMLDERRNHSLFVKARLRDGVLLPQAESAVGRVAAALTRDAIQGWDPTARFTLVPLSDVLLYPPLDRYIRGSAWLLSVVVGLVLLLACTNLASFLLARALDRHRDIAVRLALGASRGTLVRGLLVETTLLSVVAGAVGLALSVWMLRLLVRADLPLPIPIALDLTPDWTVLAFTLGVSATAGALLGIVPAWQSTRPDLVAALKSDTRGGGRPGHRRWRNALVIAQVTVSLVLLVGAGLFLRSFQRVLAVDPGFGREPAAILSFIVPATRFNAEEARLYTRQMIDRFRQVPGVVALGLTDILPLNTLSAQSNRLHGRRSRTAGRPARVLGRSGRRGLRLLRSDRHPHSARAPFHRGGSSGKPGRGDRQRRHGAALLAGRGCRRAADSHARSGRRRPGRRRSGGRRKDQIDRRAAARHGLSLAPAARRARPHVVARTSRDEEETALALMAAGRSLDPDLWVWETKTIARHLAVTRLPAELSAFILAAFAGLALMLASIGLYGVVSYAVAQRTREMGIRVALGAEPASVVRLVAFDGLRLVLIGAVLGMAAALGVMQLLSGLLFGGRAFDAVTLVVVLLVLGASASLAAYLPARRVRHIDPMLALRAD